MKAEMKSFEQKDLLGRTIEQYGACGFVFYGSCLKEHQIGRKECEKCKWRLKAEKDTERGNDKRAHA